MRKQIGAELTKVIKKRYIQLLAFSSFYSIQQSGIGKMESLAGDLDGYYSMRLSANYRLIVRPGSLERSSEALKLCDTLVIEGVVDYHGGGNKSKWIIP